MRKLVIAVVTIELLALTAGGTALANDRELMDGLAWTRTFKAEQPVASRAIARACTKSLATSANLSRDGALRLFGCIRREAAEHQRALCAADASLCRETAHAGRPAARPTGSKARDSLA